MAPYDPLPVDGYRPQSAEAIALVNINKRHEEKILRLLDQLAELTDFPIDKRWLAIGRTHIQQGWMAINRSIFQPGRISLPEDDATAS